MKRVVSDENRDDSSKKVKSDEGTSLVLSVSDKKVTTKKHKYTFASDNNSHAHPKVMQAMVNANTNYQSSYDHDEYGEVARLLFRRHFGENTEVYFVLNGSGANTSCLLSLVKHFEAVLCTPEAHIYTDECGAPERIAGCKLMPISSVNGKFSFSALEKSLSRQGDIHQVQVRVLSLTQITELGTVYSHDEIRKICEWAHKNNILVHMDGARVSNAIVSQGCSLKEGTFDLGIDCLSFGGTKNGLCFGEAVVFRDKSIAGNFEFARKQCTQLLSKSRYITSQFIAYLEDDLWRSNAENANTMARRIVDALTDFGVNVMYPSVANEIFIRIKKAHLETIQHEYMIYLWTAIDDEYAVARIVTSWATKIEDVEDFLQCVRRVMSA